jgi:hypothetical protein
MSALPVARAAIPKPYRLHPLLLIYRYALSVVITPSSSVCAISALAQA